MRLEATHLYRLGLPDLNESLLLAADDKWQEASNEYMRVLDQLEELG